MYQRSRHRPLIYPMILQKRTCFTEGQAQQEDMTTGLFFREYLLKQFSDYRNQSESEVLQYEMEYLIAGKDSDVANLAGVAERMLAIREVANYIYLKGDAEKTALANTIALVTAGWTANPAVVKVVEEGILVAWAFSESIKDVKTLLKGGKGSFFKRKCRVDIRRWSIVGILCKRRGK